jgi:Fe-S-cluster-containing dehydrogenase component
MQGELRMMGYGAACQECRHCCLTPCTTKCLWQAAIKSTESILVHDKQ